MTSADPQPATGARVAFQGELGAFSEEAVHRYFGPGVLPDPRREFADVGRAVADGEVDFGLLPIENSLAGSVIGSYDVLAGGQLQIVGEVITPIHHCVLGLPGARLDGLERILSHPVALMQCTRFLHSLDGVEAIAVYDTAGAAREVGSIGDPARAAIAAERAAGHYGLEVLARNVEDREDNQTRFLVVTRAGEVGADSDRSRETEMKTSLLLEVHNLPGSLLEILTPFARRGINLTKIESRPAGEPWSYRFFLELQADAMAQETAAALEEIRAHSVRLDVLGSYPAWSEK